MLEYKYIVEIQAVKELTVRANSQDEADKQADMITSTQTIPIEQEDIVDILVSEAYVDWADKNV